MPGMHTIVVVDDHVAFRARVRGMLEAEGFDVVGEAGGVATALEAVTRTRPAVALVDVGLQDGDGFDLADDLAAEPGASRTIVVLTSSREAAVYGARLAGAPIAGFIAKDELSGGALRALLAGARLDVPAE
jgi:DNA-binding NarL/FixJ family response regulator